MIDKISSGRIGEELAVLFLRLKGYRILRRNLRTRRSELDIIVSRGDCLAFVEVKLRGPGAISQPGECVDARKRRRLTRGAALFLQGCPVSSYGTIRFDVVAITYLVDKMVIDHIEDAFPAEGTTEW